MNKGLRYLAQVMAILLIVVGAGIQRVRTIAGGGNRVQEQRRSDDALFCRCGRLNLRNLALLHDRAFEWLERAYAQRVAGLTFTKVDPLSAPSASFLPEPLVVLCNQITRVLRRPTTL